MNRQTKLLKWTMSNPTHPPHQSKIEHVVDQLASGMEIKADEIAEIVHKAYGQKVNCYPGDNTFLSTDVCFFVSLTSSKNLEVREEMHGAGKGHLSFKKAMITIVKHMQGSCCPSNHAVFITDNWNAKVYEEWRLNLEAIQEKATLDVFLLVGDHYSRIKA